MQCKERVDLLEALRQSREEKESPNNESNGKMHKSSSKTSRKTSHEHNERGFIGEGTIPAMNFPEVSRPLPALPPRPALITKHSSEMAVVGRNISSSSTAPQSSSRGPSPSSSSSTLIPIQPHKMKKSSRSPSPEKRTMLHTLRSGGKKLAPKAPRTPGVRRPENTVTNKAATLAWNSLGRATKDRVGRSLDDADNSTATLPETNRKTSSSDPAIGRPSSTNNVRYDSTTRTLVRDDQPRTSPPDLLTGKAGLFGAMGRSNGYPFPPTDPGQPGAVSGSTLSTSAFQDLIDLDPPTTPTVPSPIPPPKKSQSPPPPLHSKPTPKLEPVKYPSYYQEYPETTARKLKAESEFPIRRKPASPHPISPENTSSSSRTRVPRKSVGDKLPSSRHRDRHQEKDEARRLQRQEELRAKAEDTSSPEDTSSGGPADRPKRKQKQTESPILADPVTPSEDSESEAEKIQSAWDRKVASLMKSLPKGVDEGAAKQIFNEIVVQGDEVHWDDVAGLEIAKKALKEAVVYPFLRPDLFMGLREPARGMLLFGPPGTGKTMLARAVATESRSTFFSISASSLTSKFLGESEKLVRALFSLAKALAPSIIFVDEIDSLLSSRSGSGEHEATRRIKTEFLIQWSDLQRAAAGREQSEKEKERGDASRVLVLAATNLPWAIDEAARRRFVRRQYIPLPEDETRAVQLRTLLGHQKHSLTEEDIQRLVSLTGGMCHVL